MHMKRGSVFDLQGKTFFTFGGGQTKEIEIRRESKTWWERELPTPDEVKVGKQNLEKCGNKVDYIVTHEPPASVKEFLNFEVRQISYMHTFFDAVKDECEFQKWFFGKVHKNKLIPPKYQCLFEDVVCIEGLDGKSKKR